MEENEVRKRIEGLDENTAKRVVCAIVGHSRIVTKCFGYVNCARCGATVGDCLGGSATLFSNRAEVGCGCKTCKKNYKKLTWRDKFMAPDPLAKD